MYFGLNYFFQIFLCDISINTLERINHVLDRKMFSTEFSYVGHAKIGRLKLFDDLNIKSWDL